MPKSPKPKTRSGAKWTEAQYQASGYHQLKVRVGIDTIAKLDELCSAADESRAVVIARLVAEAPVAKQGG